VKLFVVDGTFELFRAYYSFPPSKTQAGQEVGAARGLFRSLVALLRNPEVTHVACAFDHVIESFRNELFPGYKTGEGIDRALLAQFELAEEVSRALGIVTWPMVEFEADDALATAAARFADSVDQVVICSPDKDLCQCVQGERVVCFDRMRERTLNEAGVIEKFGVAPSSIPDYLALVGDSADGIPGIPRWGAKSAASLLAHYGKLEQIPTQAKLWSVKVRGAENLALELAAQTEAAQLYRTLATLRYDAPIQTDLEELRWLRPDQDRLSILERQLEDLSLSERANSLQAIQRH